MSQRARFISLTNGNMMRVKYLKVLFLIVSNCSTNVVIKDLVDQFLAVEMFQFSCCFGFYSFMALVP